MKLLHLKTVPFASLLLLLSCGQQKKSESKSEEMASEVIPEAKALVYDTSNPETILASIAYAHGGWNDLWKKHDVQYTYDYRQADGKADVSTERYIFDSEASYGHYTQHDVNIMPNEKGEVKQVFNGKNTKVMMDGKEIEDPQVVAVSDFLRRANYYWFTMPYKLNDNGTVATYEGQEEYNGKTYDKVKVTYDPEVTGKEQNDTYVLYVNPETKLVDRFYFSLPFLGVNEPLIVADYHYEDIDGQMIATKREYYMPSEQGYSEEPNLVQTLSDISFNNGFTVENISE